MNTWIGHTKDHLIKERGVPTREARLSNGEEVVEYHHTRTASDGSSVGMPVLVGGTPLVIGSGNEVATYSCIVTYYLRDSKIYNWKFQGNDCY